MIGIPRIKRKSNETYFWGERDFYSVILVNLNLIKSYSNIKFAVQCYCTKRNEEKNKYVQRVKKRNKKIA